MTTFAARTKGSARVETIEDCFSSDQLSAFYELFERAARIAEKDEKRRELGLGTLKSLFTQGKLQTLASILTKDDAAFVILPADSDRQKAEKRAKHHKQLRLSEKNHFTKTDLIMALKKIPAHVCARCGVSN